MKGKFKIKPITSLNRKKGRDEEWAVDKAKEFAEEQERNRQESEQRVKEKEKEAEEPASEEFKEEYFQMMKEKHPAKKSSNWYDQYKQAKK